MTVPRRVSDYKGGDPLVFSAKLESLGRREDDARAVSSACLTLPWPMDRLVGLVVKASASRAEDLGFESRLRWDFSGVESYQ